MSLLADELELQLQDGQRRVRARRSLAEGLSWGPFRGSIRSGASSPGQVETVRSLDPCQLACQLHPGHRVAQGTDPFSPQARPEVLEEGREELPAWECQGGFLEEVMRGLWVLR